MLVACTSCHARFDAAGYRDVQCPTCGAVALPYSAAPEPRPCPRCRRTMQPRRIHDVVFGACGECRGAFLEPSATKQLAEQDAARLDALVAALRTTAVSPTNTARRLSCPVCGVTMQRKLSETGAGIIIDLCTEHGTFFDHGELHRLVAFAHRQAQEHARRAQEQHEHAQRLEAHEAAIRKNVVVGAIGAVGSVGGHVSSMLEAVAHDGEPPPRDPEER